MYKLIATITKDIRILTRDKVGLTLMFVMPIILAIVIASIQNSTFKLVNENKIALLLCNKDTGDISKQFSIALEKAGIFQIKKVEAAETDEQIKNRMHAKDAFVAIIIPNSFSEKIAANAKGIADKALHNLGVQQDSQKIVAVKADPVTLYYHPVLQESFRRSIDGAIQGALQLIQSKQVLRSVYSSLNEKELPDSLENQIATNTAPINEIPVSRDGSRNIPNATQHNIPAWTIFAMFFIVISLGSSIVREKTSGSFIRLKTLPTSYLVALASKQLTYLTVTILQAVVIFAIGIWLFPVMGLPKLNIPSDILSLFLVTLICGWCAVSFAICIGVFAQTQEQSNGFGAVSIVLLAAIGGVLVPSFVMPASFRTIMQLSPLHWCLELYYGLFLEGGKLSDIWMNIIPLLAIIILIHVLIVVGLKKKNLI
ncbi:MAG: ABC transporter permease [Bacteroidetes bacterium]|nr:ABC transporter permease [Bacteroidota bacterium]MBS1934991.1 ABC transporter permease [Bacteroidota bacterium]